MNNLKIMQTGILKYLMVLAVSCCLTSSFVVSQEDETIGIESVTTKSQEEIDRELQQELEFRQPMRKKHLKNLLLQSHYQQMLQSAFHPIYK